MKKTKQLFLIFTLILGLICLFQPEKTVSAASKIAINKKTTTVYVGNSTRLKLTGTKKKAHWSSSNKKVATVSSTGKITAKKAGKATITAKVNGKKYKCTVKVKKWKINASTMVLCKGNTQELKVLGATKKVSWSSSNKKVATVSSTGTVTAKKSGKTTITAKVNRKKYKCTVEVKNWALNAQQISLCPDSTYTLKVTGTTQPVTWSASDQSTVLLSDTGTVTGTKAGHATIKAQIGKYAYLLCQVNVTDHIYEKSSVVDPNCEESGYTWYTCKLCKASKYRSDWVKALGHNYVNGACTRCGHDQAQVTSVTASATKNHIKLTIQGLGNQNNQAKILEVKANEYIAQDSTNYYSEMSKVKGSVVGYYNLGSSSTITFDRYNAEGYDYIYSKYYIVYQNKLLKGPIYITNIEADRTLHDVPASSKKGILGENAEYAKDLGVSHTALNLNLVQYIYPNEIIEDGKIVPVDAIKNNVFIHEFAGKKYYFNREAIEMLDKDIRKYSDAGISVTLILNATTIKDFSNYPCFLTYGHGEYSYATLMGINTSNAYGRDYWIAFMEFIGERYSRDDKKYGYVSNYTIGNEIDYAPSYWQILASNEKAPVEMYMEEYMRALRLASLALNKYCNGITVTAPFTHAWSKPEFNNPATNIYAPKTLVDYMNTKSKEQGDFNWGLSPHCYGSSLALHTVYQQDSGLHPTQGRGGGMTGDPETSTQITFTNLEILEDYLEKPEMKYNGKVRKVYLNEQGVSSFTNTPEQMEAQAAYLASIYYKIAHMECITAFNYYRLIDHPSETVNSACFGLLYQDGNTLKKKPAYEVYKYIDTNESYNYANPYLKHIIFNDDNNIEHSVQRGNIKNWKDTMTVFGPGWNWDKIWDDSKIIQRTVTVDRTLDASAKKYREGQKIMISATGTAEDIVGLYQKSDDPLNTDPIYWYNVNKNHHSGVAYTLQEQTLSDSRSDLKDLPQGEYTVYLFENGDHTKIADQIDFSITTVGFTLEKTEFEEGEDIIVSAEGNDTDWIGIYAKEDIAGTGEGTKESIYWYSVGQDGHTSGDKVILQQQFYNNTREDLKNLPAGEYKIMMFANGGYTLISEQNITITKAISANASLSTDKTVYREGDPIKVTAESSATEWVGIYAKEDIIGDAEINADAANSIYWYYVKKENHVSGKEYILQEQHFNSSRLEHKNLPAGEYKIVLLGGASGYRVLKQIDISILKKDSPSLIATDKTTYATGEPIKVTCQGTGDQWVGLYAKNDIVGDATINSAASNSIYWYYIAKENHASGKPYILQQQHYNNSRPEYKDLPAGEYKLILLGGDSGYVALDQLNISITETGSPIEPSPDEKTLDTNKTTYYVGEDIRVTARGTSAEWVGIYAKNDIIGDQSVNPAADNSIYWYYVEDATHSSGSEYILQHETYNDSRSEYQNLPAGEYKVVLLGGSSGYDILKQVDISIQERLSTNRTEYTEGDLIKVTALGTGTDWVGIYAENDVVGDTTATPNAVESIYWYYVNDSKHNSGDSIILQDQTFNTPRMDYLNLPAGKYKIILFENGGYNTAAQTTITIKPQATGSRQLSTDKNVYNIGEKIMTTASGSVNDWVGIYTPDDVIGYGPGTDPSIYWYTIGDATHTVGNSYILQQQENNFSYRPEYTNKPLPAGRYKIVLLADGGYEITKQVNIIIQ